MRRCGKDNQPATSAIAFIGVAGGCPEGEDAVIHEHHADGPGTGFGRELARAVAREVEPRHHVRDDDGVGSIKFAGAPLAVGRIGDGEQCVGMRVVDVRVGQDRVQDRLDGWRRRARARDLRRELVHHPGIGEGLEAGELHEMRHAHRREARRLDRLEVPAAAFHAQDIFFLADRIAFPHFD
jgi:hypothetical protein